MEQFVKYAENKNVIMKRREVVDDDDDDVDNIEQEPRKSSDDSESITSISMDYIYEMEQDELSDADTDVDPEEASHYPWKKRLQLMERTTI